MVHKDERIFISGRYTSPSYIITDCLVELADYYSREIAALGFIPFCPHKMMYGWEKDNRFEYDDFLRITLAWLLQCDAIFMLPNWEDSKGAIIELDLAKKHGLPVFYDLQGLINYYKIEL